MIETESLEVELSPYICAYMGKIGNGKPTHS